MKSGIGIEITGAPEQNLNDGVNGVNRNLKTFLIKHISRGIDNERHRKYFPGYDANYVAELIIQQVVSTAINDNTVDSADSKIINKIIQQKGDAISKSFIADPSLIARFLNQTVSVDTIFENYVNHGDLNRQIFEQIVTHHSDIATFKSWDDIYKSDKKDALQGYATAANSMGEKAWVKAGNAWIESMALQHCISSQESPKDTEVSEMVNRKPIEKIRLLDVGSCYNPFESCSNAAAFAVTALDLCPARDSVYQCDFLKVSVTKSGSMMEVRLIQQHQEEDKEGPAIDHLSSSKARRLDEEGRRFPHNSHPSGSDRKAEAVSNSSQEIVSLPAGSFDAVAMSLVLSYLPDPAQRRVMLLKAQELLRPGGMLFIFEKESIFHTGKYFPVFLRNWKVAVESCGFEKVTYTPLRTPSVSGDHSRRSHAFAFRAAAAVEPILSADRLARTIRVRRGESSPTASNYLPRLWIKQDFQRDVSTDGLDTAPLRLDDIVLEDG